MKKVFLYAGQGSQKVGMGKDFMEAFPTFADQLASLDPTGKYRKIMFEGPMEELTKTENTQVCMSLFAAGVTALLKENNLVPAACCGLSLGEYGALYGAGVFDVKTYISLVEYRGKKMQEAAVGLECAMAAVLGLDNSIIEEVLAGIDCGYVVATNYNCPGQTVICGDLAAMEMATLELKNRGAKRVMPLNVSGPFHTAYMKPAADALRKYFENYKFQKPVVPVALNVTGKLWNGQTDIKDHLFEQIQTGVKMEEDLRTLLEEGYRDFLEIGPGNTLTGFLKKTAKAMELEITISSIESVDDFRKVIEHE